LDAVAGTEFIYRTWKYAKVGSMEYISQSIERNISSGVFTRDGKLVSGIITISAGAMGMLHTDRAYRNKNYGKLCMQNLMKELAKNGFIPASAVEICNEASKKFHKKIGMKICNTVDYVRCDGPTVFK
jgi:ribosomal protein S18 acetylase RimI-like enzyme